MQVFEGVRRRLPEPGRRRLVSFDQIGLTCRLSARWRAGGSGRAGICSTWGKEKLSRDTRTSGESWLLLLLISSPPATSSRKENRHACQEEWQASRWIVGVCSPPRCRPYRRVIGPMMPSLSSSSHQSFGDYSTGGWAILMLASSALSAAVHPRVRRSGTERETT